MKKLESPAEKAMGIVFYFYYLLIIPFAIVLLWWMHGDINLTFDSEGLPIITQFITFFFYFIPAMVGFVLVLLTIFGICFLYYRLMSTEKTS